MFKHMLKVYWRIVVSCWATFGFGKVFLKHLFLIPIFFLFTHVTLLLDAVLFRKYRKVRVEKPVFIVGIPRSGTTFLHHLLTQTREVAAFETWQIIFPALTARVLAAPLVRRRIRNNRDVIMPEEVGHGVFLDKVEEEEMLFLHILDTQFVFHVLQLGLDDREHPSLRLHDQQPHRRQSARFFRSLLQRQIASTGNKQVFAQVHFSTQRIKTLLAAFPDAKFIYVVRSPYETIPSHLSLTRDSFDFRVSLHDISPERMKRVLDRTYRYNVELYRYFSDLRKEGAIPEEQLMVLPYQRLRSHLAETFEEIVAFAEFEPTEELRQAVKEKTQNQKNYKRKHQVSDLSEFGLSEEDIRRDLSFVFEEYQLDKERGDSSRKADSTSRSNDE